MSDVTGDPDYAALRRALEQQYRIESIVHESPDGAVYRACDLTLDRPVVIKAAHPALAGPWRFEEFEREARILASLHHPAIPSVHHAEPLGEYLHVVVEDPGGDPLERRLRERPLPPEEVVRIGVEVLGALEVVHARGLAHRDVQEGNVILAAGRCVLDGFARAGPAGDADIAEDLRAAALLLARAAGRADGQVQRLPYRLRFALERALAAEPAERWPTASAFRAALQNPGRRPVRWGQWARTAAVPVLAAVSWYAWPADGGEPPPPRELAIMPFKVDGGQPLEPLGTHFTHLVQLNLDNLPGLELTSRRQVDYWWTGQGHDPLGIDWAGAARDLQVHWVAYGLVDRRPGDLLRVRLTLYDSLGTKSVLPEVRGPAADLAALGDSVTLRMIRVVSPRADSLYEPVAGLAAVPLAALKAFLQGEAAFAQDAWALAQRYYEIALEHDPAFALAEWRLANVKRWRRLPYEVDLREVYRRHAHRFRPRDGLLIEALIDPDLKARFAKLDTVIASHPADGYARLLQGEELFHRGPLVGRGIEQAVAAMAAAVALDPALALAHDHLVLAAVRLGRRDEARHALARRRRLGTSARPGDLAMVPFLKLVYDERFVPWRAALRYRYIALRKDRRQLAEIERVARMGTPWLDMPHTQLRYSELLLRAGESSGETHATAHEGKGLAYVALGRWGEALAQIDSAAALLDLPEARLQRAEWRVVPAALGMPAVDAAEGLRQLEELSTDSVVRDRAIWALALAAQSAGDTALARRWTALLSPESPLRALLEAREAALHGDLGLALARSDSARLAFQVTRPPDAFAGAAFHLLRGDWFAALGDRGRADAEWLWYEASDVEGWPVGLAQAGEVDGALGVFARLKRARARLVPGASAGDTLRACGHLRRIVQLWAGADSVMSPLLREASGLAEQCPR